MKIRFFSLSILSVLVLLIPYLLQAQQAEVSPWGALTQQDVETYCDDIRGIHPGMVDPYAPGFADRVEQACKAALETASEASSYFEWRDTMGELVGGFRDGHTTIRYQLTPTRYQWPGFLIYGQGDGWVVRRPDLRRVAPEGDPPEGAMFLGCDGQSADAFLKDQLDPARADWTKAPERIRLAYRAFVMLPNGEAPPAETCRFESDGQVIETALTWRTITHSDLVSIVPTYTRRGLRRDIDVAFGEDGHAWVRLANVSNVLALKALEQELLTNQDKLRSAPYVVFDLRGNGGGNSMWGGTFASILWGEEAVESRRLASATRVPGEYGKYWRASQWASEAVIAEADEYATQGPEMKEFADFWRAIGEELGAQKEGGLLEDECCQPTPVPDIIPDPEYTGKVFVITDAAAFSSGVVVMNTLKLMGAIHLGEPSGQNEVWGEVVGPLPLPSGLGTYRIPVSIIRQPRSSLGGLPPDIAWPGAMDDEEGIRAWVEELAKE